MGSRSCPYGTSLPLRAIQLGLKSSALEAFGKRELLEVIDMTEFVAAQREVLRRSGTVALMMPLERV